MVDSWTFANYYNEASRNAGSGDYFQQEVMDRIYATVNGQEGAVDMVPDSGNSKYWSNQWNNYSANTDWYDIVYKDWAFSQEHNMSVSGGTDKIGYYASANYLDQSGLCNVSSDKLKRYTMTAKFNAELSKWVRLDVNTRFIRKDYDRPSSLSGSLYDNLSMNGWPTTPFRDPYGNIFGGLFQEVMKLDQGGRYISQNDELYMQGALIIEPIKGWTTHLEANYRIYNSAVRETWFLTQSYYTDGTPIEQSGAGTLNRRHTRENYMNINAYTDYSHSFAEVHNMKVMFGFQTEGLRQDYDEHTKYGFITNDFPYENAMTDKLLNGEDNILRQEGNITGGLPRHFSDVPIMTIKVSIWQK